jgi:methionine synthase I (cobalamin-dependent)
MAQVTLDYRKMLMGTDIKAAMTTMESLPIDVFGMNCSTDLST